MLDEQHYNYDAKIGFHYNHFRDYDASLGRYIQSDPIELGMQLAMNGGICDCVDWADVAVFN